MKKSRKLKRKTIGLLAKNLIVLSVLIAVTVVGVRSWFTTSSSASATSIQATAEIPEELEIAIVKPGATVQASDWKTDKEISLNATNFSFLQNLNFTQVTGDGHSFISPYLAQEGGIAVVDTESTWDSNSINTEANEDYLSFDLYMRTKASGKKVVLTSETYCGPVNASETFANLEDGSINNNSVVGALRFAAVPFTSYSASTLVASGAGNGSGNHKLFWIPAPNIYYHYNELYVNANGTLSVTNTLGLMKNKGTEASPNLENFYSSNNFNGTYKHNYYTSDKSHKYFLYDSTAAHTNIGTRVTANTNKNYKLGYDASLGNLSTSSSGYYVNKVRINLWIEGEDPEARAAQVAGEFKLNMKLGIKNAD